MISKIKWTKNSEILIWHHSVCRGSQSQPAVFLNDSYFRRLTVLVWRTEWTITWEGKLDIIGLKTTWKSQEIYQLDPSDIAFCSITFRRFGIIKSKFSLNCRNFLVGAYDNHSKCQYFKWFFSIDGDSFFSLEVSCAISTTKDGIENEKLYNAKLLNLPKPTMKVLGDSTFKFRFRCIIHRSLW